VVEAVGEGVTSCAVGDEVVLNPAVSCRRCPVCLSGESPLCASFQILGEHRWGAHGELVLVPAENVVAKPASLSWAEAAAYPLVYLTAWRMLQRARLRAGETMLVVGVGGGVSAAGLALGVAMGAAGAFDSGEDFPVKADVVFENVGAATWDRSLKALAPGGRLVTCGGTAGSKVEISLPRLFFKQHEIIGSTMGSYAEFDQVTRLVASGRVPVVVDQALPVADFPEALERLERGDQLGKLVLTR
jgi:NADPH:quinone reductase-like Zn-dependent oxidoreductase